MGFNKKYFNMENVKITPKTDGVIFIKNKNNMNNKLLLKLRQPIHISYISDYIFKKSLTETKEILKTMIDNNFIEELSDSKDYYILKKKN